MQSCRQRVQQRHCVSGQRGEDDVAVVVRTIDHRVDTLVDVDHVCAGLVHVLGRGERTARVTHLEVPQVPML